MEQRIDGLHETSPISEPQRECPIRCVLDAVAPAGRGHQDRPMQQNGWMESAEGCAPLCAGYDRPEITASGAGWAMTDPNRLICGVFYHDKPQQRAIRKDRLWHRP